ncbi:hypothetical protein CSKR_201263 [Clonorchis sinensis]|uniref:Uncharacterized protein n=1 Tax=Clonorchis sinensis TaxID=79923 RepID=A0A3R7C779_CLOSI|nr:hypothetical protein CSKR_201263 [Clonorchis sinensis]
MKLGSIFATNTQNIQVMQLPTLIQPSLGESVTRQLESEFSVLQRGIPSKNVSRTRNCVGLVMYFACRTIRKQRGDQPLNWQRGLKETAKRFGAVGATRIPEWGPRDPHRAWLETLQNIFISRLPEWCLSNKLWLYRSKESHLNTDVMLSMMMMMIMITMIMIMMMEVKHTALTGNRQGENIEESMRGGSFMCYTRRIAVLQEFCSSP